MTTTNGSCRPPQQPFLLVVSTMILVAAATTFAQPHPPPPGIQPKPIYYVDYDPRTMTWDEARAEIITHLLTYSSTAPYPPVPYHPLASHIDVLGPQRADFFDEPPAWIYVRVIFGDHPHDKVTLHLAIDDLYLFGFSNGTGDPYKFDGDGNIFKGLPGAKILPIKYNYGSIIKGGHKNLYKVPLGNDSLMHASKSLAYYDHTITPEAPLKDGVVRVVVMMSEGLRLRPIRQTFSGNMWQTETFISKDQARSVVNWGKLSTLLIRWDLTTPMPGGPKWGGGDFESQARSVRSDIKVTDGIQAAKIPDLLLRPKNTLLQLVS